MTIRIIKAAMPALKYFIQNWGSVSFIASPYR
jgi:hypothetical protein